MGADGMDADAVSSSSGVSPRRRRFYISVAVVALLIIAAGLRLYRLGMPDLWGDEILYLRMCHPGLSVTETVLEHTRSYSYIGHLPSAAVLTNLGLKAMGAEGKHDITSFSARLPSVIVGLMTVALLGLWVFRMSRNERAALLCLAISGLSFLHIWYSREAYHYCGEVFYAVIVGFLTFELTAPSISLRRSLALLTAAAVSGLLVTFSHPTGALMPAILAIYALAVALFGQRRNWRLYVAVLIFGCLAAAPVLLAGTGQDRASTGQRPWSFAPVESWHLVQFMTLGPGWWRGAIGLVLIALGVRAVLRGDSRREKLVLVMAPLLLLAIHVGRNYPYRPRYSLLLWPFIVHLLARGGAGISELLPAKRRYVALAAVIGLFAIAALPGYRELYRLRAKRDQYETLAKELDLRLPAGTVCVWDEGHAFRFVPDFHLPEKPFLFSTLSNSSVAAFEQGIVQRNLRMLASSFPCVALIEYGSSTDKTSDALRRQGKTFRDDVVGILPEHVEITDPGFASLVDSGWYPNIVPSPVRSMTEIKKSATVTAGVHLFARSKGIPDPVVPVFTTGQWRLVFLQNGAPMMIGPARRELIFAPRDGHRPVPVRVKCGVVGLVPGQVDFTFKGNVVGRASFSQAGQAKAVELRLPAVGDSVLTLEFHPASTWGKVKEPSFGVLSVRSEPWVKEKAPE